MLMQTELKSFGLFAPSLVFSDISAIILLFNFSTFNPKGPRLHSILLGLRGG